MIIFIFFKGEVKILFIYSGCEFFFKCVQEVKTLFKLPDCIHNKFNFFRKLEILYESF